MVALYQKIKEYQQKYGVLSLLKKVFVRLSSYTFYCFRLNFYCLCKCPEFIIRASCPLEIRTGTPEDIELIVDFMPDNDPELVRQQVKFFFKNGGELFFGFSGGQLAHIARLCYPPGVTEISPLEIHPPVRIREDEVFIGFCQTSDVFRGKNIYPSVLQHIVAHVFRNGYKRCFISTVPSRIASVRGIEKAGFMLVSSKWKFRVFGKIFNNTWSSSSVRCPE